MGQAGELDPRLLGAHGKVPGYYLSKAGASATCRRRDGANVSQSQGTGVGKRRDYECC